MEEAAQPQQNAPKNESAAAPFAEAVQIMARLRAPGGCPWDREQTFSTIRRYTLEETYEVLDAIERSDWPGLMDELGDLLLQVLFYAQMASEEGHFTLADVLENLNAKLIRRHPHVFGSTEAADATAVLKNWDSIKQQERAAKHSTNGPGPSAPPGLLDAVPRNLPALVEAEKLGSKAAKVGFDWPDVEGLFDKLAEETAELRQAIHAAGAHGDRAEIASETGDLLFTAANLARRLHVDAEFALRDASAKFRRRFTAMEQTSSRSDRPLHSLTADELEELWRAAKQSEAEQAAAR